MKDQFKGILLTDLIVTLNAMDRNTEVKIYFDPDTWLFYLLFDGTLKILVPEDAYLLCSGHPCDFYIAVCRVLSLRTLEIH